MSAHPIRSWASRHRIAVYVVLAYALSWAWWLPLALSGATTGAGQGWPTHLPGLAGPAVAAVAVTAVADGRPGLADLARRAGRWAVPVRWYILVIATLGLVLLAPIAAALTGQQLPDAGDYTTYSGVGVLPAALVVLLVLIVNGFGEETGWRGFLAEALLPRYGVVRTALLVAPVWALWHVPLFWFVASFVDLGPGGAVGWFIGLTAGSVVLTWIYRGSGHSIAIVALWHTAFNLVSATDAGAGVPAAAASTIVMLGAVGIAIRDRRQPSQPPS